MRGDARTSFRAATLRQIVHISVGGSQVRIRISNLFGAGPLHIEDAHLALRRSGCTVAGKTDHVLRFEGRSSVVVPPGMEATSDPLRFPLQPLADVAVSVYLPNGVAGSTFHASAHESNCIAKGDQSGRARLSAAHTTGSYYFLTNLDVEGKHLLGSIVTLGASITEGYKATDGANRQWPAVLAQRLAEAGIRAGVLNEGISGNRLLVSGAGESAERRFQRDVLEQPGVKWVIFSDDPINDLGSTRPPPTGAELIGATKHLIAEAHEGHMQFFCSTLTPFQGAGYWTPQEETAWEEYNAFARSRDSGCDAVIDQDRATHDPGKRSEIPSGSAVAQG
jgi:lysophospholipase L1-like esterase